MGYAQWRVLRSVVARSSIWVWVTAGAWVIGIAIPVTALSLAPNSWPGWVHAVIGVVAAMVMGVTVGALTGRTLERLLDSRAGQLPVISGSRSGKHRAKLNSMTV